MKQLVLGILAHVDAGKTTLSEALLYRTGAWTTKTRTWTRTRSSVRAASRSFRGRRA